MEELTGTACQKNSHHSTKRSYSVHIHDLTVEDHWKKFKEKLYSLIDRHIPKKKTRKIRKLAYITPEIKKLIRRRNRTYKKF
jgi:divalent metal cation (Fe/Co/Zn/Cd) transporter